jgi:hypothetical protein
MVRMESLDEINRKLDVLVSKIEILEKIIKLESTPVISTALKTLKLETAVASKILQGYTTMEEYRKLSKDDITLAIISSLEKNKVLNILQLADEVRKLRGKSSRRIVRKKLEKLSQKNIVEEVADERGRGFTLKEKKV